jgi:hypothetical protein
MSDSIYNTIFRNKSKYMGITPLSDGNFTIQINKVVTTIIESDWNSRTIKTGFIWNWFDNSDVLRATINNTG